MPSLPAWGLMIRNDAIRNALSNTAHREYFKGQTIKLTGNGRTYYCGGLPLPAFHLSGACALGRHIALLHRTYTRAGMLVNCKYSRAAAAIRIAAGRYRCSSNSYTEVLPLCVGSSLPGFGQLPALSRCT